MQQKSSNDLNRNTSNTRKIWKTPEVVALGDLTAMTRQVKDLGPIETGTGPDEEGPDFNPGS